MEIITCNNNEIKINSYLIKANNKAIVIDPNNNEEIIKALGTCNLDYILLTHEHFDHIMAVDKLREKFNAKVIAQKYTSRNIQKPSKNLSKYSNIILELMNIKIKHKQKEFSIKGADIVYLNSYKLLWQNIELYFAHTPGHSKGSSCILINNFLFTGDSLFEYCDITTKIPGGNQQDYENITLPFFNSLKKSNIKIYPGHFNSFNLNNKDLDIFNNT